MDAAKLALRKFSTRGGEMGLMEENGYSLHSKKGVRGSPVEQVTAGHFMRRGARKKDGGGEERVWGENTTPISFIIR